MKIKNIKIQTESGIQELSLSTDEHKNLNFVVGPNASGKTRMFNEIKSYFLDELPSSKTIIDLEGEKCKNSDLVFFDSEDFSSKNLFEDRTFSDDERVFIVQKSTEVLKQFIKTEKTTFEFNNNKLVPINQNGFKIQPAYNEAVIIFLASFIVIRDVIEPNLPLILDSPFYRLNHDVKLEMISILQKYVSQVLVFSTDQEYMGEVHREEADNIPSVHEMVNEKKFMGSLYLIKNSILEKQ